MADGHPLGRRDAAGAAPKMRATWCCLLTGTAILIVMACQSPARTKPATRRALVPLSVLGDRLAICRLDSRQPVPSWAKTPEAEFFSATRTPDELSLIVAESRAPKEAKCERGWRLLKVQGPLDFSLIGIVAGLSGTLADAGISLFAMSTYDTDYVMVKQLDFDRALTALRQAGYPISQSK